jgi:hypothetical protein
MDMARLVRAGRTLGGTVIVNRHVDEDDELARHLKQELNIPLDWPQDSPLTAQHVAEIASAAACDVAYDQAAGSHLLDLLAALPLPGTDEGQRFWGDLWFAVGSANANLLPANVGPMVSRAAQGEGGLADHIMAFIDEMSDKERAAAAEVIGKAIADTGIRSAQRIGELWLRDAEITAWRVLLARRHQRSAEERREFFQAWRKA